MVAKTIGTKISFAWETEAGVRPTSGYIKSCDFTAHPDLNPEADQIETTTLCATHNHTYEDGLVDFGTLEFGANMTNEIYDLFLGTNGFVTEYENKKAQGLNLWVCIDIQGFDKSYYIPVKPQPFGLPSGEAGSNKYDLVVRFSVTGDAGWYDDPIYSDVTTYNVTVTGYVVNGVRLQVLDGNRVVRDVVTSGTSTVIALAEGNYVIVASKDEKTSQIKDVEVDANKTVTFSTFA